MQAFSGGPSTPIEQVAELGEQIIEKLVAAGITTVEALADMTPEQLEEVPGIGDKTLEKISTAVRHYFGQYEEGDEGATAGAGGTDVAKASEHKAAEGEEPAAASVDLSESSVYGKDDEAPAVGNEDVATEGTLDQLEAFTGGADDEATEQSLEGVSQQELDQADAEAAEQIDALELNLHQEDEIPDTRDGSGRITDDTAQERLAEITEVGPMLDGEGAESLTPGRDDTSAVIREHHPNMEIARSETVVEGNLDETRDERKEDAKVDEGGA